MLIIIHYSEHTIMIPMTMEMVPMMVMMLVCLLGSGWVIYWGRGRLGCLAGRDWRRFGEDRTTGQPGISFEKTFSF